MTCNHKVLMRHDYHGETWWQCEEGCEFLFRDDTLPRLALRQHITSYLANNDSLTPEQLSDLLRDCRHALGGAARDAGLREPATPDGWISIKRTLYDELLANQRDDAAKEKA